ncbi:MAG: ABC transporter ATP-binding protein [Fibrobacterota bacterium]
MFELMNIRCKGFLSIPHLKIPGGEITCISGPSGSGKSTLLRLLNAMIAPCEGQITFQGEDISTLDPVALRRKAPMLPQNPALFAGSIMDNLTTTLAWTERQDPGQRTREELLQGVGLHHPPDHPATRLSGGEIQRLALARLLILEPAVLLLDEPSSALDTTTEDEIITLITRQLRRRAGTLIMVTHSAAMAARFAHNRIRLIEGQVIHE